MIIKYRSDVERDADVAQAAAITATGRLASLVDALLDGRADPTGSADLLVDLWQSARKANERAGFSRVEVIRFLADDAAARGLLRSGLRTDRLMDERIWAWEEGARDAARDLTVCERARIDALALTCAAALTRCPAELLPLAEAVGDDPRLIAMHTSPRSLIGAQRDYDALMALTSPPGETP